MRNRSLHDWKVPMKFGFDSHITLYNLVWRQKEHRVSRRKIPSRSRCRRSEFFSDLIGSR